MALSMRPTGLGAGTVYKDDVDYGVFTGEWCIGRIYENRNRFGPEDLKWFWAFHAPSNRVTCEFRIKWQRWKVRRRNSKRHGWRGKRGQSWKSCDSSRSIAGITQHPPALDHGRLPFPRSHRRHLSCAQ